MATPPSVLALEYTRLLKTPLLDELLGNLTLNQYGLLEVDERDRATVKSKIEKLSKEEAEPVRDALLQWVNAVWWYVVDMWPTQSEKPPRKITFFLLEISAHLDEALCVVMLIEGVLSPKPPQYRSRTGIPMSVSHLWHRLVVCRERYFQQLRSEHRGMVEMMPNEYAEQYTEAEREQPVNDD